MADLALSNVINVSISQSPAGLNVFNTSNLALFTTGTPSPVFDDGYKIYKEPTEVGDDFGTSSITYEMALEIFSQKPNILLPGGSLIVIPFESSETLAAAITRTSDLVQYFGIMSTQIENSVNALAAALVIQALQKIGFIVQRDEAELDGPSGILYQLTAGSYTQTRGLYYGSDNDDDALLFMAGYAGRALSTDFAGSNTTQDIHLKTISGIQPDPTMTQTILGKAQTAGADCYVSLQGAPGVFSSGANLFFDQVYNSLWLASQIQVNGFNYLRGTNTKVPQTENGMDGLKGAYLQAVQQGIRNGYGAPGVWNSPITFGNQQDLYDNIAQYGYYIYSTPISQQSQADREDRKAPLVQIAFKEAGSIQSSNVIVNINA